MATPAGGIFAGPVALSFRGIQNGLNSPAQSIACVWPLDPQRLQDLKTAAVSTSSTDRSRSAAVATVKEACH